MLDERWIRSLHVESMRRADLHAERAPHVLFQASTIGALLDGAFDGDLTFAELSARGDLGLGTLNALDGEMIALDGEFLRADVDGDVTPVGPEERTPFAVVTRFEPTVEAEVGAGEGPRADGRDRGAFDREADDDGALDRGGPDHGAPDGGAPDGSALDGSALDHGALLAALDRLAPPGTTSFAVRLDGRFETVRARSVPRQEPPYRPLAEVVADQHVFELVGVEGSMVGFRFPIYAEGIEVAGYHLHFVDAARRRGGHVLGSRSAGPLRVRIDPADDLQVELPPAVDLAAPDLAAATHAAIDAAERGS